MPSWMVSINIIFHVNRASAAFERPKQLCWPRWTHTIDSAMTMDLDRQNWKTEQVNSPPVFSGGIFRKWRDQVLHQGFLWGHLIGGRDYNHIWHLQYNPISTRVVLSPRVHLSTFSSRSRSLRSTMLSLPHCVAALNLSIWSIAFE